MTPFAKKKILYLKLQIKMNSFHRLADLLEKKVEKTPPTMMNGTLGKELRLDLVENHIEKALSRDPENHEEEKKGIKRPANEDINDCEPKKAKVNVNGSAGSDSPAPDSVSSSNGGDEGAATVSTAAAKLFADIAADILEGEDEEQLLQEAATTATASVEQQTAVTTTAAPVQQLLVDNNQQVR